MILICTPIARAAGSMSLNVVSKVLGLAGLTKTATAAACGTSSRNSSSCLATSSELKKLIPVRLPSGRARLLTRPSRTGSSETMKRTGIVADRRPTPNDDRHAPANQLGRQFGQSVDLILPPAVEDRYVVAFHIAGLAKTLAKPAQTVRHRVGQSCVEESDHGDCRLLRACRERPCGCAAEQRDELATPQPIKLHSISHQPSRIAGYRISNGQSAGLRTVSRNIGS